MKNLIAKSDQRPGLKVPGRIYDIETKKISGTPKKIAESVLKKIAGELKINPDLSQLKFDAVTETILGKHVHFQQQEEGKPISGAWIRVDIDKKGKVFHIQNALVPHPVIQQVVKSKAKKSMTATKQISVKEAETIALNAVKGKNNVKGTVTKTEQTWYPSKGIPVLCWKIVVSVKNPVAEWKFYIDVLTKAIIKKINLVKKANGTGLVFDPNPATKLDGIKLKPKSKIPAEAYVNVELKGLGKSGFLDGPFVTTIKTKKRVKRPNLQFEFKRDKRAFKEVMVYYHLDKLQRYIQELGFDNLLNKPIPVNVDGVREDNSYYLADEKSLLFGTGGVDDAEDAEIIVHEYGHAIQDAQVPGFAPEGEAEAMAMGEGFGDYLAASFFANNKPSNFRPTFGSWDAYFDGSGKPKSLRRLDGKKKYPKDLSKDEHDNGEIWSSCLWQIRIALGGKQTDKLVIAHHYLLMPNATFSDAAKALITTDKQLNKGANGKMIRDVFVQRGILPKSKKK